MKNNRILNIVILVLIIVLVCIFVFDQFSRIEYKKLEDQAEQEASYNIENSPGIALVEEDFVLVPIRHGGIIKLDI